jgi:hypothetical protein
MSLAPAHPRQAPKLPEAPPEARHDGGARPGLPQAVPFAPELWQVRAAESRFEGHLGRRSLYLQNGIATAVGAQLADGIVEVDVAVGAERGFMGAVWRVQDRRNYEEFYLRPHQSGNPDATQYAPVFNGVSGWQLYHGERYAAPAVHRPGQWVRLKVLFAGQRAEIYLGDPERPLLTVGDLKRGAAAGGVGVSVHELAGAHFADFSFTPTASPPWQGRPPASPPEAEPGVISWWWVSDAFPERRLAGGGELAAGDLDGRVWHRLAAESSGLADLARVQGIVRGRNTVLARRVIVADRARSVRMEFGFSDRVKVYLNRRLLYAGDDTYRSRDYRFLGSIGYFDALYLPLAAGPNELVLAVAEDQGGWGVQAKVTDLAGLTLEA